MHNIKHLLATLIRCPMKTLKNLSKISKTDINLYSYIHIYYNVNLEIVKQPLRQLCESQFFASFCHAELVSASQFYPIFAIWHA